MNLTNLDKIKFVFEWGVMNGTIFIDNLRFIAGTLLVDNFCDDDENNSLNNEFGMFTSSPCSASIISTLADGNLSLDYDVTAGGDCYAGTWSKILADLNPYRTLGLQVKGERCGQVAASSARTISLETDKLKLGDFLLDGITEQWQQVRIPLAASSVVTDWTRSDSFVVVFEAGQGAAQGIT